MSIGHRRESIVLVLMIEPVADSLTLIQNGGLAIRAATTQGSNHVSRLGCED
jgi:hypothetical protein